MLCKPFTPVSATSPHPSLAMSINPPGVLNSYRKTLSEIIASVSHLSAGDAVRELETRLKTESVRIFGDADALAVTLDNLPTDPERRRESLATLLTTALERHPKAWHKRVVAALRPTWFRLKRR